MFRFAQMICTSDTEAEEVLQRTFIGRLARSRHLPWAWQRAVVVVHRGPAERLVVFTVGRSGEPSHYEELTELGCDAGWGTESVPLEVAIEQREWLTKALDSLAVEDREVLYLIDVEGHRVAEAASIFDLSVSATKSPATPSATTSRFRAEKREQP